MASAPTLAQEAQPQAPMVPQEHPLPEPELRLPPEGIQIDPASLPFGARSALGQVAARPIMIEMEGEPLAVIYAQSQERGAGLMSAETQHAHIDSLQAAQQRVMPQIEALGGRIISTYQKAYNGIQVLISLDQLAALTDLPGVKAVHLIPLHEPTRGTSVPWIGATAVQENLGVDGTGIRIAIIDSGIDYYHADLGGSGDPADYAADDHNIVEPGTFPTAKVIGGYDFAGPTYDPNSDDPNIATPDPDPDPIDVFGHGSHVAGISAGLGVTGEISPGVAPGALLYAVKVFADVRAATTLTTDGIEWAMDPNQDGDISDHVDVINMSLGAGFGSPFDPSAVASNNAVSMGIVVVAAAGNAGDVLYIHDSPGNATKAIGVAATYDNDPADNAETLVEITLPYTAQYEAIEGSDTTPLVEAGDVTGEIVHVGTGCAGETYLADPAGKVALIQRGGCTFTEKVQGAEAAGAIAAIVYNNTAGLFSMSATAGIPAVSISQSDGEEIVAAADPVMGDLVRIPMPELADTITDFSSRGPRGPDSLLKPDVAAPGYRVNSTNVGSGTGGVKFNGTSMSTPHVAGVAALLRELRPTWTPDEIKAAIMNSAVNISDASGDRYPLSRQGAGRIDAQAAAGLEALAITESGNLSFGMVTIDSDMTLLEYVRLENKGTVSKTFDIDWGFQFPAEDAGQGVTLNLPPTVTVEAGLYANVPVQVDLEVAALPEETYDFGAWSLPEFDGFITFTAQTRPTDTLKVAFHLIPRLTSHTEGPAQVTYMAPAPYTAFVLENTGPITSSVYLVPGYAQDANEASVMDNGDIRYVGMESFEYFATGTMTDTLVSFAITTYAPWHTPQPYWNEFDIYVDNDEDGSADYVILNFNYGAVTSGDDNNVFVPVIINLNTGELTVPTFPPPYDDYLLLNWTGFNAATLEMLLKGVDIGLDDTNTDFDFWVVGFDYSGGADLTTVFHGDAAHPPMGFLWMPPAGEVGPFSTNVAAVAPNLTGYYTSSSTGILALYYTDTPGTEQAQFIELDVAWSRLYLPLIARQ